MEGTDQMVLPLKKRRHPLTCSPPKIEEDHQCPTSNFTKFSQNSDPQFPNPRPTKRLCTGIRDSEFKTLDEKADYLWEVFDSAENPSYGIKPQKETTDYLWGLFDFIRAEFSVESEEDNKVMVFGAMPKEKNFGVTGKKVGMENRKKKKGWWKSMVSRGYDKLRKEKMRLRRKTNVKNLLSRFWNRPEEEFEWKIEHKQDPYAFLSLPVSTPIYGVSV